MMRRTSWLLLKVIAFALVGSTPSLAQPSTALAVSRDPIALGAGRTEVRLAAPRDEASGSLAARVKTMAADRPVYLKFERLTSDIPPGVTYNAYLDLPPDRKPQGTSDPHYVGAFTFFNAESGRAAVLNITDQVKRLAHDGKLRPDSTLTIVAAGEPSKGATPRIGRVLLSTD
jgi:hypothetical protein